METDLSIDMVKIILLLSMFVVAGAAGYLTTALTTLIGPISRQLIEMHKCDPSSLQSSLQAARQPNLRAARDKYIGLLTRVDNVDTAEFSAGEIERLSLRVFGREVTAASAHSWIHQAPGILISLGLLGTFWGLTVGLRQISGALTAGATPEDTMEALTAIVAPMATAFQTSLVGLLLSLIVLITSQLSGARTCLERCESLLSSWLETVLPQELGDKLMTPLKKSIDGLNETASKLPDRVSLSVEKAMNEAFAEKLAKMFNLSTTIAVEAQQATRQLSAVTNTLNESGQDFVMAARAFQQSKFPEALRESVSGLLETKEQMTASSESLSARMQEVRDSLLVMQTQWQLLAKSAETELETCRTATQKMNEGMVQLQTSSQALREGVEVTAVAAKQLNKGVAQLQTSSETLGEGVEVTAVAANQLNKGMAQLQTSSETLSEGVEVTAVAVKQLEETRLEVMRDRKLSIKVAEAVRNRLAIDSSASEICQAFAEALCTALEKWNTNVSQLDSLRQQFIQAAIDGRNEDQDKIQEIAGTAQKLIGSINSGLRYDIANAISNQRQALDQLNQPMTTAQQLTTDIIQLLESLKTQVEQQATESSKRSFWSRGD